MRSCAGCTSTPGRCARNMHEDQPRLLPPLLSFCNTAPLDFSRSCAQIGLAPHAALTLAHEQAPQSKPLGQTALHLICTSPLTAAPNVQHLLRPYSHSQLPKALPRRRKDLPSQPCGTLMQRHARAAGQAACVEPGGAPGIGSAPLQMVQLIAICAGVLPPRAPPMSRMRPSSGCTARSRSSVNMALRGPPALMPPGVYLPAARPQAVSCHVRPQRPATHFRMALQRLGASATPELRMGLSDARGVVIAPGTSTAQLRS